MNHINKIPDRRWDWITRMVKYNGYKLGAEVGVANGANISRILQNCPQLTMYAVDRWEKVVHDPEKDGEYGPGCELWDPIKGWNRFKRAIAPHKDRVIILRGDSVEMANEIEDGTLDFVFIDANHTYNGVKRDIIAWIPKLRSGGVVCGHDYDRPKHPGVRQAVTELFSHHETAGVDFIWFARKEDHDPKN